MSKYANLILLAILLLTLFSCNQKQEQKPLVKVVYNIVEKDSIVEVKYENLSNKKLFLLAYPQVIQNFQFNSSARDLLDISPEDQCDLFLLKTYNNDNVREQINLNLQIESIINRKIGIEYSERDRKNDSLDYFNRLVILYPNTTFTQVIKLNNPYCENGIKFHHSNFLDDAKKKINSTNNWDIYKPILKIKYKDFIPYDGKIICKDTVYIDKNGAHLKS